MNTDQARRIVTLHDNADRALGNLRNANSMSTDDPRATELLEGAGDAYAAALVALTEAQDGIIDAPTPTGGLLDSEDRAREAAAGVAPPEAPADAPSAPETPPEDSGEAKAPKSGSGPQAAS